MKNRPNKKQYLVLNAKTAHRTDYLPPSKDPNIALIFDQLQHVIEPGRAKANHKALRYIIANGIRALQGSYEGFRVSLSSSRSTGRGWHSNTRVGRMAARTVIDALARNGYLMFVPGTKFQCRKNDKWSDEDAVYFASIVLLTRKFKRLVTEDIRLGYTVPHRYVQVRDRDTKRDLHVPQLEWVELIATLSKMNDNAGTGRVTVGGVRQGQMNFTMVYHKDGQTGYLRGGRIYAQGHAIQRLPSDSRLERIRIDKCKCVELDFKSMHMNLILEQLASSGHDVKQFKSRDPYEIDFQLYSYDEDREVWALDRKPQRQHVKRIVMTLINSRTMPQAEKAVRLYLIKNDLMYHGTIVQELIAAIRQRNPYMTEYFCSDSGLDLQGIDGQIALQVIEHFANKREVILPYHDSFIVREDLRDELEAMMRAAWLGVMGSDQFCGIE